MWLNNMSLSQFPTGIPLPCQVTLVFNTITEIWTATDDIIQINVVCRTLSNRACISLLTDVPTLERKFMFTYQHIEQSI